GDDGGARKTKRHIKPAIVSGRWQDGNVGRGVAGERPYAGEGGHPCSLPGCLRSAGEREFELPRRPRELCPDGVCPVGSPVTLDRSFRHCRQSVVTIGGRQRFRRKGTFCRNRDSDRITTSVTVTPAIDQRRDLNLHR